MHTNKHEYLKSKYYLTTEYTEHTELENINRKKQIQFNHGTHGTHGNFFLFYEPEASARANDAIGKLPKYHRQCP